MDDIRVDIPYETTDIINFIDSINDIQRCRFLQRLDNMIPERFYETHCKLDLISDHFNRMICLFLSQVPAIYHKMIILSSSIEYKNENIDNTIGNVDGLLKLKRLLTDNYTLCRDSNRTIDHVNRFNNNIRYKLDNNIWYYNMSYIGTIKYVFNILSNRIYDYLNKHFDAKIEIPYYRKESDRKNEYFEILSMFFNEGMNNQMTLEIKKGIVAGYNEIYNLYDGLCE